MLSTLQINQIIHDKGLCIKKDLGQNFLINLNVRDHIIAFCQIQKSDIVLEIGPGLGALTEDIVPLSYRTVAVEKDRGLAKILEANFGETADLQIINKDILKYNIAALSKKYRKKIKVVGNLPYYITSPILFYLIEHRRYIDYAFITIQADVAKRIVSRHATKEYGVLSCSLQYYTNPIIRTHISNTCFYPRPEVDSSFIELQMLEQPAVKVKDEDLFFKVIKASFNLRRKTLFNALSGSPILKMDKPTLKKAFKKMSLDPTIRGEMLTLQDFATLTNLL